MPFLKSVDHGVFFWLNGLAGGPLDYCLAWTTFLITPLIFIFVLIHMFIWDGDGVLKKFTWVLILGAAGGVLAPQLIKHLVDRPRPFNAFYDEIAQGKVIVHTTFQLYLSNSFPSGHAALVFAVVTALNLIYKNKLLWLYPVAAVLAITRVYVGAHFPSDVLAGAMAGIAGVWITYPWLKRFCKTGARCRCAPVLLND
ncbi:MAG: hypothetical protein A3C47_01860 [Omnitrophica bacterium RIFCSPHIGHO2_02_FULL_51_18]|nr:MAG: hypothetical protein A3C47_01860 [Omnitrophica bacterium RIFCSPHIGHO2_02_FULL_51_18]